MEPRDTLSPPEGREQELQRELVRAYEHLTEITSRLLLVNEAVEATLSTHDRSELCERFLRVISHGTAASRSGLFLVEGDGYSLGASLGLTDEEQEALVSSAADMDACSRALAARTPLALEDELLTDAARASLAAEVAMEEADEEAGAENGTEADEEPAGRPHFGLYIPVHLDDAPAAVLALGERVRGVPYGEEDLTFLRHTLSQLAVALNRALLIEQNAARLEELQALVRVSREITSTLDLDAVLRAVANTAAAVIQNDRASIALLKERKLGLRAVSGMTRLAPDQAELFHLEPALEYLTLSPARLQIAADDLGGEEDPPGAAVFGPYFERQEMRSFMAVPLRDDQGLLGFLMLESRQDAWEVESAEGDTLDVLAAQATVAIRNALLYSQIPLRGMALPVSRARATVAALDPRTRRLGLAGAAVALVLAVLPIVPERAGGSAEIRPLRALGVRAPTDAVVARVFVRGGERVARGQPLAVLEDPDLASRLAALRSEVELARRAEAGARSAGDLGAWRTAQLRRAALESSLGFEEGRSRATALAAPFAGEVLDLDLAQQVGRHLAMGESFCTVAALDTVQVVIEVPEARIARVRPGEAVALKVMAFPDRVFRGRVIEVGWRGRPAAGRGARFEVRAAIPNPEGRLRPGMTGIGRATVGRRSLAGLALEPPLRAFQLGWW